MVGVAQPARRTVELKMDPPTQEGSADSPVPRTVSQYRRHLPFKQPPEPAGLVQLRGAVDGAIVQPGRHLGLGL